MVTVSQMKCACEKCLCIVQVDKAVCVNDRYYCSTACSQGTCANGGCGHSGCNC